MGVLASTKLLGKVLEQLNYFNSLSIHKISALPVTSWAKARFPYSTTYSPPPPPVSMAPQTVSVTLCRTVTL